MAVYFMIRSRTRTQTTTLGASHVKQAQLGNLRWSGWNRELECTGWIGFDSRRIASQMVSDHSDHAASSPQHRVKLPFRRPMQIVSGERVSNPGQISRSAVPLPTSHAYFRMSCRGR